MLVTLATGATSQGQPAVTCIQRLVLLIAILLSTGCLIGCQTRGVDQASSAAFPPPATSWPLADDPAPKWRISSEFSATMGRGTTTRTFRAILTLERNGEQLHFIALSPLGIPMFTATLHADGELNVEQQVPTSFEPARVLAELQFCLWPSSLLNAAYIQPWGMTEDAKGRTLLRRGEIVATAEWIKDGTEDVNKLSLRDKAARMVVLHHLQQHYEIRIRPLAQSGAK